MTFIQCGNCSGSGKKYHQAGAGGVREFRAYPCPSCGGRGHIQIPDPTPTRSDNSLGSWVPIILGLIAICGLGSLLLKGLSGR